jgi:hypothetical protein
MKVQKKNMHDPLLLTAAIQQWEDGSWNFSFMQDCENPEFGDCFKSRDEALRSLLVLIAEKCKSVESQSRELQPS